MEHKEQLKAYREKRKLKETNTERRIKLDAKKRSYNKMISQETESKRQTRLEKKKSDYQKKKIEKIKVLTQKQYLKAFNTIDYGKLHQQNWAKSNISKFHTSISYCVYQCSVCNEAWPLKSKPQSPSTYICSRCVKDKKSPKRFSTENSMSPSPVPPQ